MPHLVRSCPALRAPVAQRAVRLRRCPAAVLVHCSAIALPTAPPASRNGNGIAATAVQTAVATLAPPPLVQPGVLPPQAAYDNVVQAGAVKAAMPAWKALLMGTMAGCYISFGGFLAVSVSGSLAGTMPVGLLKLLVGIVFPFGLMINLVIGGELFTGNTAFITAAVIEKKATLQQLARNWLFSYIGNFIGSLLMVGLAVSTGLMAGNAAPINMALAKTSLTFGQAFVRGVLCNWLVCCAVWMAASATTLPGKTLGCWLPVTAFVTMGLEHSIANMFFIFAGIALGAQVTVGQALLANLLPVTLGNMLGGVLCMATAYSLCYGALGKQLK